MGLPERYSGAIRDALLEQNKHLRYMETDLRGWLQVTFTMDECVGEWHVVDTVLSRDYRAAIDKRLAVKAGEIGRGLQPV